MKKTNLVQATRNSIRGLLVLFSQKSAQRELGLLLAALVAYVYHPLIYLEIIILLIGLTLAFESLNTAIEKLSDLVEPNFSTTIKEVKDLGSSSILIVIILIACILIRYASEVHAAS